MTRRIYFAFILIIGFSTAYAQEQKELQVDKKEEKKDSIEHSVMLIPYDPRFYLSDADKEIAEATKKDLSLIRRTMHSRSEWYTYRAIRKKYPTVSLLQNDTIEAYIEAAGSLFSNSGYVYAKPMVKAPATTGMQYNKNQERYNDDSRIASQYLNEDARVQFMKADFKKKEVLNNLYEQFGTDLFVFLTQLEIKTNYKSCLDIANKIYQREVMLHFTVYDKTGKLIGGNYAVAFIPSDVNNMDEIVARCFPELAEGIAASF